MRALQVRMSGATLEQVAEAVGYNSSQAVWKAITSMLDREQPIAIAEYRAMHVARIERLLMGVWQAAIGGDDKAQQQALRLLQELGKIMGVYAPIKAEVSGPDGGPVREVLTFMPDDEWTNRFAHAWDEIRVRNATPVGELDAS